MLVGEGGGISTKVAAYFARHGHSRVHLQPIDNVRERDLSQDGAQQPRAAPVAKMEYDTMTNDPFRHRSLLKPPEITSQQTTIRFMFSLREQSSQRTTTAMARFLSSAVFIFICPHILTCYCSKTRRVPWSAPYGGCSWPAGGRAGQAEGPRGGPRCPARPCNKKKKNTKNRYVSSVVAAAAAAVAQVALLVQIFSIFAESTHALYETLRTNAYGCHIKKEIKKILHAGLRMCFTAC